MAKPKKDQELSDKELDGAAGGLGNLPQNPVIPKRGMPNIPDLSKGKVEKVVTVIPDKSGPVKR